MKTVRPYKVLVHAEMEFLILATDEGRAAAAADDVDADAGVCHVWEVRKVEEVPVE